MYARGLSLIACYLMLVENLSVQKTVTLLGELSVRQMQPFRDAGIGPADFPLTLQDILRGLQVGTTFGWISNSRFDEMH